jgi:glycosyltransferase involved in cell wall biosynthesis
MKILICNERLIFRFGVDRVLLMLGINLVERGHEVILACGRCDERVEAQFGNNVHKFPLIIARDLHAAERAGNEAIDTMLADAAQGQAFDLIIVGGWPFYSTAQLGINHAIPTIFIDAGAVPHDDLPAEDRNVQQEIRRLRAISLPRFSKVLAISRFIRDTQTVPERGSSDGVETIHLGIDHMASNIFKPREGHQEVERKIIEELKALAAEGVPLILNLGRFESIGYKNSPTLFRVLERIIAGEPRAQALILGDPREIRVPRSCRANCRLLGFLGDRDLEEVMQIASLGISTSLWEGFNLPIGEMQYAGKPVLAFNIGAHPEVILNPWCLASDEREMARKALAIFSGTAPTAIGDPASYAKFRSRFTWNRTNAAYLLAIESLLAKPTATYRPRRRVILVDVSNSSRDTANSGVTRVTRRLSSSLQQIEGLLLLFVWWDVEAGEYRLVGSDRRSFLSSYGGPNDFFSFADRTLAQRPLPRHLIDQLVHPDGEPLLFIPEIPMDGQAGQRIQWGRKCGLKIAAILYDLIPINHSSYCAPEIVSMFPGYLRDFAATDLLVSISATTRGEFQRYTEHYQLAVSAELATNWLPGQFATNARHKSDENKALSGREIVCLATIEPRKNHKMLLQAFSALRSRRPELDVRLTLIGNMYHGAQNLADLVREASARDPNLQWLGVLPDEDVAVRVAAARFTVYPSLVEGFGLPILESLWLGKACLCHQQGVMAELAAGGGCLTVDMGDVDKLSAALERLSEDDDLLARLEDEASHRQISTWSDYAQEIAARMMRITQRHQVRQRSQRESASP